MAGEILLDLLAPAMIMMDIIAANATQD